ncbi:MAG: TatD family hydrolase [Armatimonadetes bacterium]|nr:TatD family hydrolase [Armatimonadota bacterium]
MIDTHAHLNDRKFAKDLDEVLARAHNAGVDQIVVCGYDLTSSRTAIDIALRFEGVFATVGVHPHDAKSFGPKDLKTLRELARNPKVVAIGETGLDFHRDLSPRPVQIETFKAQIDLAKETGLPVVVHSRKSNEEALEIIEGSLADLVGGVFHCFSGEEEFAQRVIDAGFYIGIDGPITFGAHSRKNGAKRLESPLTPPWEENRSSKTSLDPFSQTGEGGLRRVVEITPRDRLLLETDCPYLTPAPHRGKRNEPAYLIYVAKAVAEIWNVAVTEVDRITAENARRLFGLP